MRVDKRASEVLSRKLWWRIAVVDGTFTVDIDVLKELVAAAIQEAETAAEARGRELERAAIVDYLKDRSKRWDRHGKHACDDEMREYYYGLSQVLAEAAEVVRARGQVVSNGSV